MAVVFRVEMVVCSLTGSIHAPGPYTYSRYALARDCGFESVDWLTSEEFQPEPEDDNMVNWYGKYFAFKNLQQFYNWFNCDINRLKWGGFHLVQYEVSEDCIIHGNSQVCFNKDYAQVVGFMDIFDTVDLYYNELTEGYIEHLYNLKAA